MIFNCDYWVLLLEVKSDANEIQADESNIDGESDNETNTTNNSMITESKPYINTGWSLFWFIRKIIYFHF